MATNYRLESGVAVLEIDHPPVNALSLPVRQGLVEGIRRAVQDASVRGIVIGARGSFPAGADINEIATGLAFSPPILLDVQAEMEAAGKPVVAAISGTALGGGFELALTCHARVAAADARMGLPEVKLGLIPGAGGTQRFTRLAGPEAALEAISSGVQLPASRALALGLIEAIAAEPLAEAIALARRIADSGSLPPLASARSDRITGVDPALFTAWRAKLAKKYRGQLAPLRVCDAIEAACTRERTEAFRLERQYYLECRESPQRKALMHVFHAEREARRIPGVGPEVAALPIRRAAVIGAGTMGTGIAITFAQAGIPVVVIDSNDAAVEKAKQTVFGMFMYQVQKGRMTQEEAWKLGQSIQFTEEYGELADADVVVEAVFESMDVKKEVFAKVDAIAKPSCMLASNTSTLDIDAMASVTKRPERFLGLHFFVPANIMPLLEIVRGKATSPQTLATAFKLGKTLRKTAVLSTNAFGFIGNRMVFDYAKAAGELAEWGVSPMRVDKVAKKFGFPMGPFAMGDLSGIDVAWHIAKARPDVAKGKTNVIDRLVEMKRLGQKTMAGYFKYDKSVGKGREPIADPEVEALFAEEAKKAGIAPRTVDDREILERLAFALINRGAFLLEEGVALRPGDIDIVYVYGYGFPPHHGGPMWYADEVGVKHVYERVVAFGWEPAPLLKALAEKNGTFANYKQGELIHA